MLERLIASAQAAGRRIAFADADDDRVLDAACRCAHLGVCRPMVVTSRPDQTERAQRLCKGLAIEVVPASLHAARTADHLLARRSAKGLAAHDAQALALDPLYVAGTLVAQGIADGAIAGSLSSTPDVVRAALWTVGTGSGVHTVSSFFLMLWPDRTLIYSDCGVVPQPTSAQLAEIAASASENFRRITATDPRVAFLSFSTKGSAKHPSVDHVRQAYEIFHAAHSGIMADGELQFDAAFVPSVAMRKAPSSPLAGTANVMIFPNLDAGNIAYKITERIGGAVALGPIIQGLDKPYCDLSRGCSADDIVHVAAITALMCD